MSLLTSMHFTMTTCLVELMKSYLQTIQEAQDLSKKKDGKGKEIPRKKRKREGCDSERRTYNGIKLVPYSRRKS